MKSKEETIKKLDHDKEKANALIKRLQKDVVRSEARVKELEDGALGSKERSKNAFQDLLDLKSSTYSTVEIEVARQMNFCFNKIERRYPDLNLS